MSSTKTTSLCNVHITEWGECDSVKRPKSAPSSPNAGRKLLPSRLRSSRPKKRFHYGTSKTQMNSGIKSRRPRPATMTRPSVMASSQDSLHTQRPHSVAVVKTAGYTLFRSPAGVQMNINTRKFFGDKEEESAQTSKKTSSSASAVFQASYAAAMEKAMEVEQALQVEIAEMHIKLEDEKQHHQHQVTQMEGNFEKEKKRLLKAHDINVSDIKRDHERETGILHNHYAEQKQEIQHKHEITVADLQERLDYTEELLETTKIKLEREAEERVEHRERELKAIHSSELQELEFTMKEECKVRLSKLRTELTDKHQQEVEEMKSDHEAEVKALISQFNEMYKLEKKLAHANKQIKKLEKDISKQKSQLKQAHSERLNTEAKLLETQRRLEEFELNYQENVKAVQGSFKGQLDSLMHENAELRRRLLHKADQFCEYKASVEKQQIETLRNFKDKVQAVVRARSKARLSVATNMDGDDHEEESQVVKRPTSAPATCRENTRARNQVRGRVVPQRHKNGSLQSTQKSNPTVSVHK